MMKEIKMGSKRSGWLVAGLAMMLGCAGAHAQVAVGRTSPDQLDKFGAASPGAQGLQDKIFIKTAAEGGIAEIELGKLALQKASNSEVKGFAQVMVVDHSRLNADLKPIAEAREATTPKKMNKADQAEYNKLSGLSADAFDKEYIAFMVKDHTKDLKDFKTEADLTQDPALKPLVTQGAQMISGHLAAAQKLAAKIGA